MKILVVEKHAVPKLAASLGGGGHVASLAKDEKAALTALAGAGFQLLLITLRGVDAAVVGLVEGARKLAACKSLYVVVIAHESTEDFLVRLHGAGADLCLRAPLGTALLLAQLDAAKRVVDSLSAGSAAGTGAQAPLEQVNQSTTWRLAQAKVQEVAAKFLSMDVTLAEADSVTRPVSHACSIMLSNVEHQVEIRVAVAAEAACGQKLAVHMFGPEGADMVADVLSELSNIVMGMLKSAFGAEMITFTGGLPSGLETAEVLRPLVLYAHNQAFALRVEDGAVLIHLSVRSKANQFLALSSLREGMVLAKDVFNARGLLMVHGGTRLSMNMIDKISGILPAKTQLEVVAP